jgi:hypothetical protein
VQVFRVLRPGVATIAMAAIGIPGCTKDPEIRERGVFVFSPRSCPALAPDAATTITATGDFASTTAPKAEARLGEIGRRMDSLPSDARALVVGVRQGPDEYVGLREVPPEGPINILVWRQAEACALTRDVERRSGSALAVFDRHMMIVGGRSVSGEQVPSTFVGDLTTGAIERLAFGSNTRRARPSVTAFGRVDGDLAAALVAGGEDPDTRAPLQTAELYVPKRGAASDVGEFDRERIELSEPRAQHGAVVLANGATLLVGGRGTGGPLRSMEIIDPSTRRARTAGVALLRVARKDPTVLRLANGEILVAGGRDATDAPVPTLEWFSPDASRPTKRAVDLVTGKERAFVALDAGGALAVIIPDRIEPDFKTVWRISADGTLEPAEPLDPESLETLRLFDGAGSAPVLWTGRAWLRWTPWGGAFQPIANAPARGPAADAPIVNGDPGLALWLEDNGQTMNVSGFRFAARTRFDALPSELLISGPDLFAPDRLAGGEAIRVDPDQGVLLGPGASVFLPDVTFADFDVTIEVTAGPTSIVLRRETGEELAIGGAECAFAQAATRTIAVERRGASVSVRVDGGEQRACPPLLEANARVFVGLRGSQAAPLSGARNFRILRR